MQCKRVICDFDHLQVVVDASLHPQRPAAYVCRTPAVGHSSMPSPPRLRPPGPGPVPGPVPPSSMGKTRHNPPVRRPGPEPPPSVSLGPLARPSRCPSRWGAWGEGGGRNLRCTLPGPFPSPLRGKRHPKSGGIGISLSLHLPSSLPPPPPPKEKTSLHLILPGIQPDMNPGVSAGDSECPPRHP